MNAWLGLGPDQVAAELRVALVASLSNQLATVEVSEPTKDPKKRLRFTSTFTLQRGDLSEPGVVWYDVTESLTLGIVGGLGARAKSITTGESLLQS